MQQVIDSLATYHLLGRSDLRVSPLCLGTMTFGTEWGWGSDEASTLIGATRLEQLEDTLRALEGELSVELAQRLEEASRPEPQFPYTFHGPHMQAMVSGGCRVTAEPVWSR